MRPGGPRGCRIGSACELELGGVRTVRDPRGRTGLGRPVRKLQSRARETLTGTQTLTRTQSHAVVVTVGRVEVCMGVMGVPRASPS